jgi:hypothetical protein
LKDISKARAVAPKVDLYRAFHGNPKTKPGSGPVKLSIYTVPRAVPYMYTVS